MFDIDFTRAFKELVEVGAFMMTGMMIIILLYSVGN